MRRKRRTFSSEFKLKVILDSLKERESLSELSQKYDLHQNQISKWKIEFLGNAKSYLKRLNTSVDDKKDEEIEKLYSKIGKLQMELDFLKKKLH